MSTCIVGGLTENNGNVLARSVLLVSNNVRKQSPLEIEKCHLFFWHFSIWAKLSDLRRFHRDWYYTHYAWINSKQTKLVLVRARMPGLPQTNNPIYTFTQAGHFFVVGSCDARTLLGTVIWLFFSQPLYTSCCHVYSCQVWWCLALAWVLEQGRPKRQPAPSNVKPCNYKQKFCNQSQDSIILCRPIIILPQRDRLHSPLWLIIDCISNTNGSHINK